MRKTSDLHIVGSTPLATPDQVKAALPVSAALSEFVYQSRNEISAAIRGESPRLLVIVGPCSTHDPRAALDYASRLQRLRRRLEDDLLIVMRVYFEKPRTTVGWKGLINDPHLDGSCDIAAGIQIGRKLFLDVAEMGLAVATEMLDPILPQYLADLVSWTAIGARTTESQTHREMASGLSMPIGYKNGTDGSLSVAINALISASKPHSFLGIDGAGRVAVVRTTGSSSGHIILRGGSGGPNYSSAHVQAAVQSLKKAHLPPRVVIDCSHDNSGKNHLRQTEVIKEICSGQLAEGSNDIMGLMIESNIVGGRQDLKDGMSRDDLVYGQSITDSCIDFSMTEEVLTRLAQVVRAGRPKRQLARREEPAARPDAPTA
jgi:3-deoxy-7-phosphoheptulonate synthase